jgi:hypothetical protein
VYTGTRGSAGWSKCGVHRAGARVCNIAAWNNVHNENKSRASGTCDTVCNTVKWHQVFVVVQCCIICSLFVHWSPLTCSLVLSPCSHFCLLLPAFAYRASLKQRNKEVRCRKPVTCCHVVAPRVPTRVCLDSEPDSPHFCYLLNDKKKND